MLIILDQATPVLIRLYLGWDKLKNGDLPSAAEEAGFDLISRRFP